MDYYSKSNIAQLSDYTASPYKYVKGLNWKYMLTYKQ